MYRGRNPRSCRTSALLHVEGQGVSQASEAAGFSVGLEVLSDGGGYEECRHLGYGPRSLAKDHF